MISTSLDPNTGRVLVDIPDEPQPYVVMVKDASDWQEVHDYIINENEIDNIPNRRIDCTSEMRSSPKRRPIRRATGCSARPIVRTAMPSVWSI